MDESQIPVKAAHCVIPFMQLLEKAKSDRDRNQLGGCRGRDEGAGHGGHRGVWGRHAVLQLDCSGGSMAICSCQNAPNHPLKRVSFTLCTLYLKKK